MPKSKRGAALFDLLGQNEAKGTESLKVPGWWASGGRPPDAQVSAEPSPEEAPSSVPVSQAPARPNGDGVRFLELDGNRVRLSFTSVTAALAVFATLVALLAAVEWGQWTGDRNGFKRGHAAGRASFAAGAIDEIEAARRQPPETQVVSSLLRQPDTAPQASTDLVADMGAGAPEQARWIRDYTYIVAQEFSAGSEDDARRAQAYLTGNGIATELVRYPSGAIQLITTEGFNRSDQTQRQIAEQWLKKVHTVGDKYFDAGGRYKLEGYFKTYKGDTW